MKYSHAANSIVEYLLPLAVILVLGGVLVGMGDLSGSFQGAMSQSGRGTLENRKLKLSHMGKVDTSKLTRGQLIDFYRMDGQTFVNGNVLCLQGQECLNIPSIAGGPVSETDGSLGGSTVSRYSQLLTQTADSLQRLGAPDGLVAQIRQLANSGHGWAEDWTALSKSCPNKICPKYSGPMAMGMNTPRTKFFGALDSFRQYVNAHPDAFKDYPEAGVIIQNASQNMNSVIQYSSNAWDGNENFFTLISDAKLVHMDANTVCNAGKAGPSCVVVQ